jgi:hypothetical protein
MEKLICAIKHVLKKDKDNMEERQNIIVMASWLLVFVLEEHTA